ncbi:hypothetical protein HDU76_012161, partial [Blyttiomyces sp. JEL0837]
MGIIPVIAEAVFLSSLTRFVFNLPISWSFTLSFGVASVSPGVVVPLLLGLLERPGWRNSKLPPTLLAATGIDVLIATTGFGVSLAATFGHRHETSSDPNDTLGEEHTSWFSRALEEVGFGIGGGVTFGVLGFLMYKSRVAEHIATVVLYILSTLGMMFAKSHGFPGAASSCVIITWTCVTNTWDQESVDQANKRLKIVWKIAEPFLFPVIGASVSFTTLPPTLLIRAFLCITSSVLFRMTIVFIITNLLLNFSLEDRIFTSGVWT